MKNLFLISGVVVLSVLLVAVGCLVLLGSSYILILVVNYLASSLSMPELITQEIDITKLILTSMFILLAMIACKDYRNDIKRVEKTLRDEINSLHHTLEQHLLKNSEQESIFEKLDSISQSVEGIPDIQHIMNIIYKYKLPDDDEQKLLDQIKLDNFRFGSKE